MLTLLVTNKQTDFLYVVVVVVCANIVTTTDRIRTNAATVNIFYLYRTIFVAIDAAAGCR